MKHSPAARSPLTTRLVAFLSVTGAIATFAIRSGEDETPSDEAAASQAARSVAFEAPGQGFVPTAGPVDAAPEPVEAAPAVEGLDSAGVYFLDRVMVKPAASADLAAIAASVGAQVAMEVGGSGYGELVVPTGQRDAVLAALAKQSNVDSAERMSVVLGAGKGGNKGSTGTTDGTATADGSLDGPTDGGDPIADAPAPIVRANPYQWHLDEIEAPAPGDTAFDGTVVVAVLDSGVAYADAPGFAKAPSLAGVPIVAPWDFVDKDGLALDENQHGTHIASLIASEGIVEGVAAGVPLMPLRVLDENNAGSELALVEAIHYAVEHGASIINMSLSFPYGYVPSKALRAAIQRADTSGLVMVAASGNTAKSAMSWPAQSPKVIGVGAYAGIGGGSDVRHVADYSNSGSGLDLMAPGGDLTVDANHDGLVDGLLAETILPGDPSATGLFFYQGTSQAAALVSATAALMAQRGDAPDSIRVALQRGAHDWSGNAMMEGDGAGGLRVASTMAASLDARQDFHVLMQSWMRSMPQDRVKASTRVTVLDEAGRPVTVPTEVIGTFYGLDGEAIVASCSGNKRSPATCVLETPMRPRYDSAGAEIPYAWAVVVDSIVPDAEGVGYRPEQAIVATDGLAILVEAMADVPGLQDPMLAFLWGDELAPEGTAIPAYIFPDLAVGTSMSPMQVIAMPNALEIQRETSYTVDLDGTGLATSPLGLYTFDRVTFGGSGLATSPLGLHNLSFAVLNASGLATSPLGFSSYSMFSLDGAGYDSDLLDYDGSTLSLTTGSGLATSPLGLTGLGLENQLTNGGWTVASSYGGATALTSSGAVDVGLAPTGEAVGVGHWSVSLDNGAF